MNTLQQFEKHNQELKNNLIDNEPVEAYYSIDPKEEIFDMPLKTIDNGKRVA